MGTPKAAFENCLGCAVCGTSVNFWQRPALPGRPEFVSVIWPDGAWLGWAVSTTQHDAVELMALCSQLCLARWHEPEKRPPVRPELRRTIRHGPDEPFGFAQDHPTERDL